MSDKKPLTVTEDGSYEFTLTSYDPVTVTITKPQLDYESAAKQANALIDERGGSHQSNFEWYMEEFGVANAPSLFQKILRMQSKEIDLYVARETRKAITGQLALRLEQELPDELVLPLFESYKDGIDLTNTVGLDQLQQAAPDMAKQAQDELAYQFAYQEVMRGAALDAYAQHEHIVVTPEEFEAFKKTDLYKEAQAHGFDDEDIYGIATQEKAYDHIKNKSTITLL